VATGKTASVDLDAQLGPGEKIVWRSKPVRNAFVFRTWPLSAFGAVLVTAVAIFISVILTTEAPDWLTLWAVPFALLGLYMAVGHFLVTFREWQQIEYLVTDTRVLIRHGIFSPTLTIYSLLGLPHTIVEMHGQEIGNVMFKPREGQGYGPWPGYQTMWPYTPGYLLGFLYIRNPTEVQKLLEGSRLAS